MRPTKQTSKPAPRRRLRPLAVAVGLATVVGTPACAGLLEYSRTTFVHSVGDCDAYVWPNQRSACHECVTRRPPGDGRIWSWFPNYEPPMCGAGQVLPY